MFSVTIDTAASASIGVSSITWWILLGILFFMVYGSMLFSAIGKVAAPLVQIEAVAWGDQQIAIEYVLVPIIGVVVLAYGILGGLRAAYFTDLIQGICIILLSVILVPFGLQIVGCAGLVATGAVEVSTALAALPAFLVVGLTMTSIEAIFLLGQAEPNHLNFLQTMLRFLTQMVSLAPGLIMLFVGALLTKDKAQAVFGTDQLAEINTPEGREEAIRLFLVRQELNTSFLSPASTALTLLQNSVLPQEG